MSPERMWGRTRWAGDDQLLVDNDFEVAVYVVNSLDMWAVEADEADLWYELMVGRWEALELEEWTRWYINTPDPLWHPLR